MIQSRSNKTISETELFMKYKSSYIAAFITPTKEKKETKTI